MCRLLASGLLVIGLLVPGTAFTQADPLHGLDAFVEREMERWSIPGLAVGVVRNDSVVYARGFGVLGLEDPRPVDEHTLFGVASTTKAMTAATLGLLVDRGLLHWDDRVVDHLPGFELSDPWVTHNATVRDLLTHQVGVGRMTGNRLRYLPRAERAEVVRRMRFAEFERPFRSAYVYSNVMYMVAGELVRAVTGESWDDFLVREIFRPLGMERSNTTVHALEGDSNAAWPHQEIEGEVRPIPRRDFDVVGPAASVNTSVREMAEWMRLHLGEPGVHDGRRFLSEAVMREMHAPQVATGGNPLAGIPPSAYGLGWSIGHHTGRVTVGHGGASDGMNTTLLLLPEEELGVVVVSNTFNLAREAIAREVLDRHLPDAERRDWSALYRNSYEGAYARARERRDSIHAARIEGTRPTLPLDAYAGAYLDSLYADAGVRREGEGLVLQLWEDEEVIGDLEHWHHDTFRIVWRNRAMREEWAWFTLGQDGAVDALHIRWTLRPVLLQVGAYPTDYYRVVRMERVGAR